LGHSLDQLSDRVVHRVTSDSMRVGPLLGHEATVPAQDRRGRPSEGRAAGWAASGPTRQTVPDGPGPDAASGGFCATRRLRVAEPAARHLSPPTSDQLLKLDTLRWR
jgi:hypothetical protein